MLEENHRLKMGEKGTIIHLRQGTLGLEMFSQAQTPQHQNLQNHWRANNKGEQTDVNPRAKLGLYQEPAEKLAQRYVTFIL